jgi:hypothetical protein
MQASNVLSRALFETQFGLRKASSERRAAATRNQKENGYA